MDLETRAARSTDFPAIAEVLRRSFDEVAPGFFAAQTERDSTFRLRHARVAVADGSVVAYVHIFARTMLVRGEPVPAGGIGSVATHPAARSHGLATALLEDAIAQMRRDGMRLSFLFTGIPAFYERLGFRVVREPEFALCRAAILERAATSALRVRRVDLDRDAAAMLRLHRRASAAATGRIARTARTWADALAWTGERRRDGFVAVDRRSGDLRAYIRSRCRAFGHQVLEAECAAGAEDALPALLRRVASLSCRCDDDVVALAGAATPLAAVLRSYPGVRETTDVAHPMMMLALDGDRRLAAAIAREPIAFWNSDRI